MSRAVSNSASVTIEIATGDIGEMALKGGPWMAVVSSDDSMLTHGGGSSESIWTAAGDFEVWGRLPARLGTVVATDSGELDAEVVLHAITIDVDTWLRLDPVEYATMFLELAEELRRLAKESPPLPPGRSVPRVLLPLIGTGAGEVPHDLAIRLIEQLAVAASREFSIVLATMESFEAFLDHRGRDSKSGDRDGGVDYQPWEMPRRVRESRPSISRNMEFSPEFEELASSSFASHQSEHESVSNALDGTSGPPRWMAAHSHQAPHVERLVDLLHELKGIERDDLDQWMKSLGYVGKPRLQLKELCVRMDPAEVVERLGSAKTRSLLWTEFSVEVDPQSKPAELVARMLGECGFKAIPEPRGLNSAIQEVGRLKTELTMSEPHERAGIVLAVSGRLERVVGDLLRFLCLHLYRAGPERYLKGKGGYDGRPLSGTTLGMLLTLLSKLVDSIDPADDGTELPDLNDPLTRERLIPGDFMVVAEALTPIRNGFAHAREAKGSDSSQGTTLEKAHEFVQGVERLLSFWRTTKPPVYPTIVRIDEITIDRWNRRLIRATSDAGAEEAIVCDQEVHPGRLYFMLPRTNPFRVDPILVEFGRSEAKDG